MSEEKRNTNFNKEIIKLEKAEIIIDKIMKGQNPINDKQIIDEFYNDEKMIKFFSFLKVRILREKYLIKRSIKETNYKRILETKYTLTDSDIRLLDFDKEIVSLKEFILEINKKIARRRGFIYLSNQDFLKKFVQKNIVSISSLSQKSDRLLQTEINLGFVKIKINGQYRLGINKIGIAYLLNKFNEIINY